MKTNLRSTPVILFLMLALAGVPTSPTRASAATFKKTVNPFVINYCIDCHDRDFPEGGVSLHGLTTVTADNAYKWKRVWEMVALKEMPPAECDQPSLQQRMQVANWITSQLSEALAAEGGFDLHLRPHKGNHLDHDLLFNEDLSGLDLEPPSTPARLWRITPEEHLVRLNELVAKEPPYDPNRPHVRTRGDMLVNGRFGVLKLTLGHDQAFARQHPIELARHFLGSGIAPSLTENDDHGLKSYAIQHTVRESEILEIVKASKAILRFMIDGPEIVPKTVKVREEVPYTILRRRDKSAKQTIYFKPEPTWPLSPVHEFVHGPGLNMGLLAEAVDYLFETLTHRSPTEKEHERYFQTAQSAVESLGKEQGAIIGLMPIFVDRDALYRVELAEYGTPDRHGRVMLQDEELMLAINAALSFLPPDEELEAALSAGRLKTREDVRREVRRMLRDESFRKPRILQFFREYFGYDRAPYVDKDLESIRQSGLRRRVDAHCRSMHALVGDLDWLIEDIVKTDKDVLRTLLTTDRVVLDPLEIDNLYYLDEEENLAPELSSKPKRPKTKAERKAEQVLGVDRRVLVAFGAYDLAQKLEPLSRLSRQGKIVGDPEPIETRSAAVDYKRGLERLAVRFTPEERMGVLTHPAWLVAHSNAMENHVIHRGIWIRERLLGGAVADVPITVDAQLPEEPESTLRHRMRVTREAECWRCHRKMDPLGLPFEMYNHVGMHRTTEQGKPVGATGEITDSGDPNLDGKVNNAIEMIRKLAESERVEQVFVRHAFRFWMGRNETLNDAPVLQAAHRAYRDSGGSMKALITSLLTSDAFLYREVKR